MRRLEASTSEMASQSLQSQVASINRRIEQIEVERWKLARTGFRAYRPYTWLTDAPASQGPAAIEPSNAGRPSLTLIEGGRTNGEASAPPSNPGQTTGSDGSPSEPTARGPRADAEARPRQASGRVDTSEMDTEIANRNVRRNVLLQELDGLSRATGSSPEEVRARQQTIREQVSRLNGEIESLGSRRRAAFESRGRAPEPLTTRPFALEVNNGSGADSAPAERNFTVIQGDRTDAAQSTRAGIRGAPLRQAEMLDPAVRFRLQIVEQGERNHAAYLTRMDDFARTAIVGRRDDLRRVAEIEARPGQRNPSEREELQRLRDQIRQHTEVIERSERAVGHRYSANELVARQSDADLERARQTRTTEVSGAGSPARLAPGAITREAPQGPSLLEGRSMPGPDFDPAIHKEGTVVRIATRQRAPPYGILTGNVRPGEVEVNTSNGKRWLPTNDLEFEIPEREGWRRGQSVRVSDEGSQSGTRRVAAVFQNGDLVVTYPGQDVTWGNNRLIRSSNAQRTLLGNARRATGQVLTGGLFRKLLGIGGPTGAALFVVSEALSIPSATAAGIMSQYMGSIENIAKFFELPDEEQRRLLETHPAYSEYLKRIDDSILSELGTLRVTNCSTGAFTMSHPRHRDIWGDFNGTLKRSASGAVNAFEITNRRDGTRLTTDLTVETFGQTRRLFRSGVLQGSRETTTSYELNELNRMAAAAATSMELRKDARTVTLAATHFALNHEAIQRQCPDLDLSATLQESRILNDPPSWNLRNGVRR